MGTDKVIFAEELPEVIPCACLTGSDRKRPVRKYGLRMRNRKLRNIQPSGPFSTGSRVTFPPYFFPRTFFVNFFSRTFFSVLFSRTFFSVVFFSVLFSRIFFPYFFVSSSTKCGFSLRRPRPITIGNYHPLYFHI